MGRDVRVETEGGVFRTALVWLAAGGLLVSSYLTWVHLAGVDLVCAAGSEGCHAVQSSRYAAILTVPVPVLGLVGYAGLLLAAAWRGQIGAYLCLMLSLAGMLFSAYLTYLEIFVIEAICQWCVASAAIMVAALICAAFRVTSLPEPADRATGEKEPSSPSRRHAR